MSPQQDTTQADAWPPDDCTPGLAEAMLDYARASAAYLAGILGCPADPEAPNWDTAYCRLYTETAQWHASRTARQIHARIADHLLATDDARTADQLYLERGRALGLTEALTILGGQP